jgi:hypothetical protein
MLRFNDRAWACCCFFFPQGNSQSRTTSAIYKDGAFNVAMGNGSDLLPISLDIPTSAWNRAHPLFAKEASRPHFVLTIHAPISSKNMLRQGSTETNMFCNDITQRLSFRQSQ